MDKMRVAEDTPIKFVLEKSLSANDLWRGWSKSLLMPLVIIAGTSIILFTGGQQPWWLWVIFGGAFLVEVFILYIFLTSERKITITIDLPSRTATRVEKLVSGNVKKHRLEFDQVTRVLLHSEEVGHHTRLLLEALNLPALEIATNYDLLTLDQGKYIYEPATGDSSAIKSLDVLGKKIGELLQKPVVGKLTDQGTLLSEDVLRR